MYYFKLTPFHFTLLFLMTLLISFSSHIWLNRISSSWCLSVVEKFSISFHFRKLVWFVVFNFIVFSTIMVLFFLFFFFDYTMLCYVLLLVIASIYLYLYLFFLVFFSVSTSKNPKIGTNQIRIDKLIYKYLFIFELAFLLCFNV